MLSSPHHLSVVSTDLWIWFTVGIVALLFVDLLIFGKHHEGKAVKMALLESLLWVSIAIGFNVWFAWHYGKDLGIEFLTGYLVEKSLSVDNLFVILLIFSSFRIPAAFQHRVLFYGVFGAVVMRAFFIMLGMQLLQSFHWILYIFGLILLVTAFKLIRDTDDEEEVTDSIAVKWAKKIIPTTTSFDGQKFFTRENGKWMATPLFLALIVIEVSDLFFAVDSIPAIFAVTQDGFVAFSSNILAVLGLRALYFVIAEWVKRIRYLKPGLATILGFIGLKLLLLDIYKIPSWVSLLVIVSVLSSAVLSSWYVGKLEEKAQKKRSS